MDETPLPPEQPSSVALVALLTELRAAVQARGYPATGTLRLPLWTAAPITGELAVANERGRLPAHVVVTIPWRADTAAALASDAPSGSLMIDFCWTITPDPGYGADLAAMANDIMGAMDTVADLRSPTVTIPTIFDVATRTVGPIELRDTWPIALADLHAGAIRATMVARIAAHAIVAIDWL